MNKYKQLYESSMLAYQGLIDQINSASGQFNPLITASCNQKAYEQLLVANDLVECCSRMRWKLPLNLTSEQLESLIYQYGSILMYVDEKGELNFSNFSAEGDLKKYGNLEYITPISFDGKTHARVKNVLSGVNKDDGRVGVIINDYSYYLNQNCIPRAALNLKTTINDELIVYNILVNDTLSLSTKALAVCDSEEQRRAILKEVAMLLDPGNYVVPIVGKSGKVSNPLELFQLNSASNAQDLTQLINFYRKSRRAANGVPTPDTFEKKERLIDAETENSATHINNVLIDAYRNRKNAVMLLLMYHPELKGKLDVDIAPSLKEQFRTEGGLSNE